MAQRGVQRQPPDRILRGQCLTSCPKGSKDDLHIWLRLLFSCLVDADFLDTERYMKPSMSLQRSVYPPVPDLLDRFTGSM